MQQRNSDRVLVSVRSCRQEMAERSEKEVRVSSAVSTWQSMRPALRSPVLLSNSVL